MHNHGVLSFLNTNLLSLEVNYFTIFYQFCHTALYTSVRIVKEDIVLLGRLCKCSGSIYGNDEINYDQEKLFSRSHHVDGNGNLLQLPGEFHGQGSLVVCRPWGHRELYMTEVTEHESHHNRVVTQVVAQTLSQLRLYIFVQL